MFYFEILIIDSQEIAKKCIRRSRVPLAQFPLMITSYITVVQYQSHECDIYTMCVYSSVILSYV